MESIYFDCACYDSEHTIRFVFDDDGDIAELYLDVFLADQPWYKRLWLGIKYIFGYKSRYGHFGNWTLAEHDAERLQDLLDRYKASTATKFQ